ncbi:hypothetical protein N7499_000932 [Penicillium canescens]|uniref:uncharacterized protein n=1 Tax=Penicillium canescens TaxID=5083 RepID=UPI0026DEAFE5|nr:uncharacterized protein N7446_004025 [Penicillium canescens]KAJ6009114.1 hypothetical protein N7522_004130 [Penicillium canescens]KAJ6040660.1 hypothetical protein N7444_009565 [Penicillium canescens]KAJ6066988.1 hypothetical protein N7446_004025 [Penicillium canescens]KAJ6101302.1 hypothetical protein N7499_000932 [Penicillium canescens]KAJ6173760.1 hypothetical protein N7485_006572 [Penicillium canescens]
MPLSSLPDFPEDYTWNVAPLASCVVDCLDLKRIKQFTATTYEATYPGDEPLATMNSTAVIAKVARFEWELPRLSLETLIYKSLEDTGLAPRFIGHVHEHGRVVGFMLEKLEGREANINDLSSCQSALQRLHDIGILHGDANRYNFIIQDDKARLIDFEKSQLCRGATVYMRAEMESLSDELVEDT